MATKKTPGTWQDRIATILANKQQPAPVQSPGAAGSAWKKRFRPDPEQQLAWPTSLPLWRKGGLNGKPLLEEVRLASSFSADEDPAKVRQEVFAAALRLFPSGLRFDADVALGLSHWRTTLTRLQQGKPVFAKVDYSPAGGCQVEFSTEPFLQEVAEHVLAGMQEDDGDLIISDEAHTIDQSAVDKVRAYMQTGRLPPGGK